MGNADQPSAPWPWPRARRVAAWLLFLASGAIALQYAWALAFANKERADGNSGHVMIDFSGQWLMGRMIVEGKGTQLYDRSAIRDVLKRAYPQADENPKQESSDAD